VFAVSRLVGVPVLGRRISSVQVLAEFFGSCPVDVFVINHGPCLQVLDAIAVRIAVWCASAGSSCALLLFDGIPRSLLGKGFTVVDVAECLVHEEILNVFRGILIQDVFSDILRSSEFPAISCIYRSWGS